MSNKNITKALYAIYSYTEYSTNKVIQFYYKSRDPGERYGHFESKMQNLLKRSHPPPLSCLS